ncbi:MAG TPA: hypothetical protein VMY18_14395 [Acidobacteriota bacterium]|nr:hypothetical protein [Acidobacteriota bacterium]
MIRTLLIGLFFGNATVATFGQSVRYFPQMANGKAGTFQFRTNLFFVNTGDPGTPIPAPSIQQLHFIFDKAGGEDWPGSPDESTVFPQRMEIDYARV